MTRDEAKNLIVEVVTELQGAKATVLAMDERLINLWLEHDAGDLFDELVADGRVVEVEYVLADMDFRAKSFYLPKGTEVRVYD